MIRFHWLWSNPPPASRDYRRWPHDVQDFPTAAFLYHNPNKFWGHLWFTLKEEE